MATGGQGERETGGEEGAPAILGLPGATIRVRFFHVGDRYAHAIQVWDGRDWADAIVSREGSPGEHWPPSPPLQSLSIEELSPGRRAALLVGMAGRSHWSLSAEADPATGRLTFDVACRPGEAAEWLGSTYQLLDQARVPFSPEPSPGVCSTLTGTEGRITLTPLALPSPAVKTIRWRYSIGP